VPIYTIGYGAREIDDFLAALRRYDIAYLIDVRSKPYSRYKPDFSKDELEEHVRRAGIRYVFMGDSLGGRPDDPACYDSDGKVDYARVAERDFYLGGIERLVKAHEQGLVVGLMCSEGKPENCHRSKLIGKSLARRGLSVAHIDENDELISQDEVLPRLTGGQPSLFGDDMLPGGSRRRYVPGNRVFPKNSTSNGPEDEEDE
jgi:uncharacterized protein (DUF488 family)